MTESDDRRLRERGDQAAREFRERREVGQGRADLAESHAVNPDSGPGHYAEASRYARAAAKALADDEVARSQALAAIGQIHATLAAAGCGSGAGSCDEARLAQRHQAHLTCLHAEVPA
jgi:hypothetical protein